MPFLKYLTKRSPRAFLLPLLLLVIMPALLPAQDLTKLTVAYSSRSISPIDYFIGEQYGFFKAEGLDVRSVQIRANVAVIAKHWHQRWMFWLPSRPPIAPRREARRSRSCQLRFTGRCSGW